MSSVTLIMSVSVIILLIYVIISLLRRKTYIGSITKADKATAVTVTANKTALASYSIWIYIDKWTTTSDKNIFVRDNYINLALDKNTNYLKLYLSKSASPLSYNKQISYDKHYGYYYSTTTSNYYYASDSICENVCDGDSTCNGFNYYTNIPTTATPANTYKTNYNTNNAV